MFYTPPLPPSTALARIGQSRETLFSPRGATEHEAVTRALSSLIPNTLALLHQEMEGGVGGGLGGPTQSKNVSAFKLAWLPFSSQVRDGNRGSEGNGSEGGGERGSAGRWGTMDLYRKHASHFVPVAGRLLGDSLNGKILARGLAHTDFAGHTVSLAPPGTHMVEADVSILFIAHYIGRPRSYVSDNKQHEKVVQDRRVQVSSASTTSWIASPLCYLRLLFRRHSSRATVRGEQDWPAHEWETRWEQCLDEGDGPLPFSFVPP